MRRYLLVDPASKSDSAWTPSIWASALAISETVMPDSLASCRSLACLNWTIDTTTETQPIVTVSIVFVSAAVKSKQISLRSRT